MRNCIRCGRGLSDPHSVSYGMGPICQAKVRNWYEEEGKDHEVLDIPYDPVTGDIVCRRDEDGTIHVNVPHAIVKHSPTGLEFGYGGSGPADLAINILALVTGDPKLAQWPEFYQDFKFQFVATMPREGGVIPGTVIRAWVDEYRKKHGIAYERHAVVTEWGEERSRRRASKPSPQLAFPWR